MPIANFDEFGYLMKKFDKALRYPPSKARKEELTADLLRKQTEVPSFFFKSVFPQAKYQYTVQKQNEIFL
jgi:hypothetical protein